MEDKRYLTPNGIVDAVLDTDTYNEIDDQFALSLMIKSPERINLKAVSYTHLTLPTMAVV